MDECGCRVETGCGMNKGGCSEKEIGCELKEGGCGVETGCELEDMRDVQ